MRKKVIGGVEREIIEKKDLPDLVYKALNDLRIVKSMMYASKGNREVEKMLKEIAYLARNLVWEAGWNYED